MSTDQVTLVLSEICGELGHNVSVSELNADKMKAIILDRLPTPLRGEAANHARENRQLKIDQLIGKKISPAQANYLKTRFCAEDSLILSYGDFSDGFEDIIEVIKRGPDINISFSEKTGPQVKVSQLKQPEWGSTSKWADAMSAVFSETERKD